MDLSISGLVAAGIAPFIINLICQPAWSSKTKQLVSLAVCIVLGTASAFLTGEVTWATLGSQLGTVILGQMVLWQSLNKTGLWTTIQEKTALNVVIDEDSIPQPPEDYEANDSVKLGVIKDNGEL